MRARCKLPKMIHTDKSGAHCEPVRRKTTGRQINGLPVTIELLRPPSCLSEEGGRSVLGCLSCLDGMTAAFDLRLQFRDARDKLVFGKSRKILTELDLGGLLSWKQFFRIDRHGFPRADRP